MAIPAHRLALVFFVAGSFGYALGQTPVGDPPPRSAPDPAAYEQFFRQVAELKILSNSLHLVPIMSPVTSSGGEAQPPAIERERIVVAKIQDVIGINDADVEVLNAAADDCVSKIASLIQDARPLIFESRLQSAESGKISDAVTQKLKDLDERHNHIVVEHVQGLKAALPDSSFEKLDGYVRAPSESKKPLIPSLGPRPVTQAAPK
jgi:hypothetical protein